MFSGTCEAAGADVTGARLSLAGLDGATVVGSDVQASAMRRTESQAKASACYRELVHHLQILAECVAEGKRLDEANDFCRVIINSRVCDLLSPYDSTGALKVDSAHLGWMAEDLRRVVCEQFRGGKVLPVDHSGTLQAINSKLDLIAGHLARFA